MPEDNIDSREHLSRLSRVYSEETWNLYRLLDRSLEPRGPDWLHQKAGEYLEPGSTVLDVGCRDAAHLIRLVQTYGVSGTGIEPVAIHVEQARAAVVAAGLSDRLKIVHGTIEDSALEGASFDFVWCRDVLEQVERLGPVLKAMALALKPGGRMLVFTVVKTDLLERDEMAMLRRHLGNVEANLDVGTLEAEFGAASLVVEEKIVIGTEWREHAEERGQPVSRSLLRLARLRRQRDAIVAGHGEDIYRHVEANLHWEVFQFLGKLLPVVYVLRRRE